MGYGSGQNGLRWGFHSAADWLDSVILSFPGPWHIGDDTHYGTEIYDNRAVKLLSVWMAFGQPSARQKGEMTDEEWGEYCCGSHWESETQWHIAQTIVSARNYLHDHGENKWYRATDEARDILRTLILGYGRWEEQINKEISCGGPLRRLTEDDTEIIKMGHGLTEYGKENRKRDQAKMREKIAAAKGKPVRG